MSERPILVTGGSGFIGTHLVERLRELQRPVVNLDLVPPKHAAHAPHWAEADIKDMAATRRILAEHQPRYVIHLAAKATLEARELADFPDNIAGTANVLEAARLAGSVERVVVTSTQYVMKPGRVPAHDTDYDPYTPYGASKVETEKVTRAAELPFTWVIVRPTNVWGPLHAGFPQGLWRFIAKRLYVHPGHAPIIKSYGYVANVVEWYLRLLDAPAAAIDRKVFYMADGRMDSRAWMNGLAQGWTGRDVRAVPRWLWSGAGIVGDLAGKAKIGFPMTSDRLYRMTTPDVVSSEPMLALLGPGPVPFAEAMARTTAWYQATHLTAGATPANPETDPKIGRAPGIS